MFSEPARLASAYWWNLDLGPIGGQAVFGADLGPLKDELVVLVAEVAVVDVPREAAAEPPRAYSTPLAFSGSSASIVTRLPRLPSAGAQNSGIRMMSWPKFHSRPGVEGAQLGVEDEDP